MKLRFPKTKFSFGATSAIITNLGLITGLRNLQSAKISIIGGILAIALADNIADSFGIHIFQESELLAEKEVWFSTLTNFLTRIFVSSSFILLVALLPLQISVICSIFWGLFLLAILSYAIAKERKTNSFSMIFEHLLIAGAVITASSLLGSWLTVKFHLG